MTDAIDVIISININQSINSTVHGGRFMKSYMHMNI